MDILPRREFRGHLYVMGRGHLGFSGLQVYPPTNGPYGESFDLGVYVPDEFIGPDVRYKITTSDKKVTITIEKIELQDKGEGKE